MLVHMHAAGLHPVVKALASGTHYGSAGRYPHIPGVDGVGHLDGVRPPHLRDRLRADGGPSLDVSPAARWARRRGGRRPGEPGDVRLAGIAAGRNPAARPALGADLMLGLDDLAAALPGEAIDVVVDYLWGEPARAVIASLTGKGLRREPRRTRFVSVGASAAVPSEALRSSGLDLLGSGAGPLPPHRRGAPPVPRRGGQPAGRRRDRPPRGHHRGLAAVLAAGG